MTANEPIRRTWLHLLVIVAVVAVQVVPSLFTRDLWRPDEPRYAQVAHEMAATGVYTLPHLNGEVYRQKPPLFFWCSAPLERLGLGMTATRVVTGVAVCGVLWVLYLLCRCRLGSGPSLLAAFIALSTVQLCAYARKGTLDPLLTAFVTAAVAFGFAAFHRRNGKVTVLWMAAYAAMGLATLTKGPVGVLVPVLVLLAYGVLDYRSVRPGGWSHLAGVVMYAAVVLSWLVPAMVVGGQEYTDAILLNQTVGRAISSWSHREPFYYYLSRWPRYLAPWSLILVLACIALVRRWGRAEGLPRLGLAWLIVPLAFFSVMSGKRMNYLLPMVPGVGIVCAWYLGLADEEKGRFLRVEKWLFGLSFIGMVGAAVLAAGFLVIAPTWAAGEYPGTGYPEHVRALLTPPRLAAALALLAVPLGVAAWGLARPSASGRRKAWLLAAAVLLMGPPLDVFLAPVVNPTNSDRQFGTRIRELTDDAPVYLFGSDFAGRFNLWTGRLCMPRFRDEDELRRILADPRNFVVSEPTHLSGALTPEEIDNYTVARGRLDEDHPVLLRGRAQAGSEQPWPGGPDR